MVEIARDLLRLMFPGFYDKDPLHSNQLIEYTNELVASVARRLENEIHRSLEYRPCDGCDKKDLAGTAARVTHEFLAELPAVRATLPTCSSGSSRIRTWRQGARRRSGRASSTRMRWFAAYVRAKVPMSTSRSAVRSVRGRP